MHVQYTSDKVLNTLHMYKYMYMSVHVTRVHMHVFREYQHTTARVEKDSEIARDGRIIAVTREILTEVRSTLPLHAGTKRVRNDRRW